MKVEQFRKMISNLKPEIRNKIIKHVTLQRVLEKKGLIGSNEYIPYEEMQEILRTYTIEFEKFKKKNNENNI